VAEFFAAARGAFQNQLGLSWDLAPKAITPGEISAREDWVGREAVTSVVNMGRAS
jgi:hypothetical protein